MPSPPFLVFSQDHKEPTDGAALVHKARAFFRVELVFTTRHHLGQGSGQHAVYGISLTLPGAEPAPLQLTRRLATEADWTAADQAELRGQATGMGALARRCPVVWEIPEQEAPERAVLTLCGILAATELGPVMPPDGSTLYGVRGARLRAGILKLRGFALTARARGGSGGQRRRGCREAPPPARRRRGWSGVQRLRMPQTPPQEGARGEPAAALNVWLTRSVPPHSHITQAQARNEMFDEGAGI